MRYKKAKTLAHLFYFRYNYPKPSATSDLYDLPTRDSDIENKTSNKEKGAETIKANRNTAISRIVDVKCTHT